MKIRNGFVSNSSSSSFIIKTKEDLELVKKYNIKAFKVSKIIKALKPVDKIVDIFTSSCNYNNTNMPDYIYDNIRMKLFDMIYSGSEYYNNLIELNEKYPDCYITEPYDRDLAYENNIDLEIFEGDL